MARAGGAEVDRLDRRPHRLVAAAGAVARLLRVVVGLARTPRARAASRRRTPPGPWCARSPSPARAAPPRRIRGRCACRSRRRATCGRPTGPRRAGPRRICETRSRARRARRPAAASGRARGRSPPTRRPRRRSGPPRGHLSRRAASGIGRRGRLTRRTPCRNSRARRCSRLPSASFRTPPAEVEVLSEDGGAFALRIVEQEGELLHAFAPQAAGPQGAPPARPRHRRAARPLRGRVRDRRGLLPQRRRRARARRRLGRAPPQDAPVGSARPDHRAHQGPRPLLPHAAADTRRSTSG